MLNFIFILFRTLFINFIISIVVIFVVEQIELLKTSRKNTKTNRSAVPTK